MPGTLCAGVLEAKGSEDLLSPDARQFVCGLVVYASSRRGEAKAALALTGIRISSRRAMEVRVRPQ